MQLRFKNSKLPILLICGLFLMLLIVSMIKLNQQSCYRLQCINFLTKEEYKLKESYIESANEFRGLFTNKDSLLRVEIKKELNSENALKYINSQLAKFKGIYENAPAPYPGEITDEISCGAEYKPEFKTTQVNGLQINYFNAYMTNRLTYGACTDRQASNYALNIILYCPNTYIYQFEYIQPKEKETMLKYISKQLVESFQCK